MYCVQYRLSEGVWTDEDIRDPVERMIELLNKISDRARVHRWALWLMRRDAELGLKVRIPSPLYSSMHTEKL